jgi:hypothetical protein
MKMRSEGMNWFLDGWGNPCVYIQAQGAWEAPFRNGPLVKGCLSTNYITNCSTNYIFI